MNPRSSLFLGVLSAAVLAAVFGYFILQRFAPDAALARAFVDVGLLVFLALVVFSFTRTPAHRVDDLADAIVELTRGNRSRRLDPAEYGELEPIARAFNDIAAHMSAQEDPNLGPIKRRPRLRGVGSEDSGPQAPPNEAEDPEVSMRIRDLSDLAKNHSYHPELGPVRVMSEAEEAGQAAEAAAAASTPDASQAVAGMEQSATPTPDALKADDKAEAAVQTEAVDGPGAAERSNSSTLRLVTNEYTRNGTEAPQGGSQLAPAAAAEDQDEPDADVKTANDTDIDALLQSADASSDGNAENEVAAVANGNAALAAAMVAHQSNISSLPPESVSTTPQMSDGERMRALFDAFVQAKQEQEQTIDDLEFDSFAAMVSEERVKLRQTHECRDVRFEVTVNSGEVSLLPRLLR